MSASKDWLVEVDFYELPDFSVRAGSLAEAQALVAEWCKSGLVGKMEIIPGKTFAEGHESEAQRHRVFPLSTVKQFTIHHVPVPEKP